MCVTFKYLVYIRNLQPSLSTCKCRFEASRFIRMFCYTLCGSWIMRRSSTSERVKLRQTVRHQTETWRRSEGLFSSLTRDKWEILLCEHGPFSSSTTLTWKLIYDDFFVCLFFLGYNWYLSLMFLWSTDLYCLSKTCWTARLLAHKGHCLPRVKQFYFQIRDKRFSRSWDCSRRDLLSSGCSRKDPSLSRNRRDQPWGKGWQQGWSSKVKHKAFEDCKLAEQWSV